MINKDLVLDDIYTLIKLSQHYNYHNDVSEYVTNLYKLANKIERGDYDKIFEEIDE